MMTTAMPAVPGPSPCGGVGDAVVSGGDVQASEASVRCQHDLWHRLLSPLRRQRHGCGWLPLVTTESVNREPPWQLLHR
jgi:hypothetical protein